VSTFEDKSIKIWNTDVFYNISIIRGYYNDINANNLIINQQQQQQLIKANNVKINVIPTSENSLDDIEKYFDENGLMNEKLHEAANLLKLSLDNLKKNREKE